MKRSLAIAIALTVIFTILALGQPLYAQVKPQSRAPQRLGEAAPPPACCSVTSIDSGSGIVTAKVTTTGATFQFKENSGMLPATLHVGSPVYANFLAKQVSLDGSTACCTIISGPSAPAPLPPSGTTQPGSKMLANPNIPTLMKPNGGGTSAPPVATPAFTPAGAAYTPAQLASGVKLSDEAAGAVIYYTTDGSTPTTSSTKYSGAIPVTTATTIKAMATASGMTNSAVVTASYYICPAVSVLEGVDVSNFNGTVDWKKVRASGRIFAYAQATKGTSFVDQTFAQNYAAIKAAGLIRGAYHTFDDTVDGVEQADYFLSRLGTLQQGDLPPVLDFEIKGVPGVDVPGYSTIVAYASAWMAHVKSTTGRTPILYVSSNVIVNLLASAGLLDLLNYPIWIPNYGVSCPEPHGGWQKWTLWQYTSTGTVPGIAGSANVDLNRFNGTLADLNSLAQSSHSQPPHRSTPSEPPAPQSAAPVGVAPAPPANQPTTSPASTSSAASAATAATGQTQSKVASAGLTATPLTQGASLPRVGTPPAQTAGSGKTLAAAEPASVIQNVRQLGALPQLSYGPPQPVTYRPQFVQLRGGPQPARSEPHTFGGAKIVHVRGVDGLEQAQDIPEGIRNLLAIHVRRLPKGESDHYIINAAQAQEWIKTHPISPDVKPTDVNTGDGHSGCKSFSWHCAEESAKHAEDEATRQADDLRQQAQKDWTHFGGELTQLWHEALSCLDDQTLHLDNIPVKFSIAPQMSIDAKTQGKITGGAASGQISGKLGLATQVDSDLQANLDVFYIPCLPFVVRPKDMGAVGILGVTPKLTASLDASGQFDKTFDIPPTGDPHIPIEAIPIIIAGVPVAELDISVHFEGNINVGGEGKLTTTFEIDDPHQFPIDFSCSGHGCGPGTGNVPITHQSPPTTTETYKLEGNAHVKPDIYVALEMNFDYDAATVRIGPQPYLWGEVNGCGTATATQNLNTGSSTSTESHALVFDLDWGMILRTEFLVGGNKEGDGWNPVLVGQSHIWFKDLWPGGSNALLPQVQGLTQMSPGQAALYHIKMPACYPFFDNVKYQFSWTGGATASNGAPGAVVATRNRSEVAAMNRAGANSSASPSAGASTPCRLLSGRGECEFEPLKDLSLNLAWPIAGTYNLSVTAVGDTHGRVYNPPNGTALNIAVGSSGSSGSATTSSAPSGGTPPAPPAQGGAAPPSTTVAATPASARAIQNKTAPACCIITAIDASTGVVTAIVNATRRAFQFQVTDSALLNSLTIDRGVYANFKTRQVSLDGVNPCCVILSLSPTQGATASGQTSPSASTAQTLSAVPPGTSPLAPPQNPNHLPDLVPDVGTAFGECPIPAGSSCQAACGSKKVPTNFGVHNLTQYPANGPIQLVLRDTSNNIVKTWTVNGLGGNQWAYPGGFYTMWVCPSGISVGNPSYNYTLEVEGPPQLTTNNKVMQLYMPPGAVLCAAGVDWSGCQQ